MIERLCIAHGGDISKPSGGTDRVSAIANSFEDHGTDVVLVAPEPSGEPVEQLTSVFLETVEVPTHGVTSQPRRAAKVTRRARNVAQSMDAPLQFEHSTLAGVGTLWGCNGYILDMHDFAFASPLYGNLPLGNIFQQVIQHIERRGVGRARRVVVVSEQMKSAIRSQWNVSSTEITVVPNGFFESRIQSYRSSLTVPGRVTFLGTLHPKLDTEALIQVARLPAVSELCVIGDGNEWNHLSEASEAIDTLELKGQLPDEEAFELVATSEVAVNPQYPSALQRTSSPVKLAYYAALGVPTVTTAGPDMATELADADAGIAVDSGNDFASAVEQLLNDDVRRESMRGNTRTVAESWQWSTRISSMTQVYREYGQ